MAIYSTQSGSWTRDYWEQTYRGRVEDKDQRPPDFRTSTLKLLATPSPLAQFYSKHQLPKKTTTGHRRCSVIIFISSFPQAKKFRKWPKNQKQQAPVVWNVRHNALHQINHYPVDSATLSTNSSFSGGCSIIHTSNNRTQAYSWATSIDYYALLDSTSS